MKARRRAAAAAAGALLCSFLTLGGAAPASAATCPVPDPVTHVVPPLAAGSYSGCNFAGADFSMQYLANVQITSSDFTGADFSDAFLDSSTLSGDMTGASFDRALFFWTTLNGNLTSSSFQGASLAGGLPYPNTITGSVTDADLRGVDATGLQLVSANGSVRLDGAILADAAITSSNFVGAHLAGADLTGATISGSFLTGADLRQAILTDTLIEYTNVSDTTDFTGADLRGVRTLSLQASNPILPAPWRVANGHLVGPGANLRGARFEFGSLDKASFADADLTGASFAYTTLKDVDFTRAILYAASFFTNDLTGSTGLSTVRENSLTIWDRVTCADGNYVAFHEGQSCAKGLDVTAPVPALAATGAFVYPSAGLVAPLAVSSVETGTRAADVTYQVRSRTAVSGTTGSFSSWRTGAWVAADAGRVPVQLTADRRTCVQVRARDLATNTSGWGSERCFDVPLDPGRYSQPPVWRLASSEAYSGYGAIYTTTRGASFLIDSRRYVRQVGVVATTCPTCGSVAIYVGSTKVGSLSLTRSTTRSRSLLLLPRLSTRLYGQVKVVVTSSSGRLVRLDDLALTGV